VAALPRIAQSFDLCMGLTSGVMPALADEFSAFD
jgi:hypothetical protein